MAQRWASWERLLYKPGSLLKDQPRMMGNLLVRGTRGSTLPLTPPTSKRMSALTKASTVASFYNLQEPVADKASDAQP